MILFALIHRLADCISCRFRAEIESMLGILSKELIGMLNKTVSRETQRDLSLARECTRVRTFIALNELMPLNWRHLVPLVIFASFREPVDRLAGCDGQ